MNARSVDYFTKTLLTLCNISSCWRMPQFSSPRRRDLFERGGTEVHGSHFLMILKTQQEAGFGSTVIFSTLPPVISWSVTRFYRYYSAWLFVIIVRFIPIITSIPWNIRTWRWSGLDCHQPRIMPFMCFYLTYVFIFSIMCFYHFYLFLRFLARLY